MKKLGNWLFHNFYLIVLLAAAPLIFFQYGADDFLLYYGLTAFAIMVAQVALELAADKKQQEKKRAGLRASGASMGRPRFTGEEREIDGESLIELAGILTHGDERAVAEITRLVQDFEGFAAEHREWCEAVQSEGGRHTRTLLFFAYWLAGVDVLDDPDKNPPAVFGAYIDWKEAADEILLWLEEAAGNLQYALDFDIPFSGEESTDAALKKIRDHLLSQGFTLFTLDTGGDCHHLFIVPLKERERLLRLAQVAGFAFSDEFMLVAQA